ncbi:protein kinase, partial [Rubrivirga sp.]|uniref:protein kinase n=1 Tax=Rubrivirga sp. TaxID=1885344 RepID=UPI003C7291C8
MDSERWHLIKERFNDVLDLEDGERRRALEELDGELRAEVEALLQASGKGAGVLDVPLDTGLLPSGIEKPGPDLPDRAAAEGGAPLTGVALGPYKVGERIGRGGMGDVYRARRADGLFDREVALKVVREGADTRAVLDRFAEERRILGGLEHPGIARLISAGAEESGPAAGRPWLALELVEGVEILEAARDLALED